MIKSRHLMGFCACTILLVPGHTHAQCDLEWSGRFGDNGVESAPNAFIEFDPDGAGPRPAGLVAYGGFIRAGGNVVNKIALWDGIQWRPIGDVPGGLNGGLGGSSMYSLAVYDDDGPAGPSQPDLYVGGTFTNSVSGVTAYGIIKWDGQAWSSLGTEDVTNVGALAVFDLDGPGPEPEKLIISGSLSYNAQQNVKGIFSWDGTTIQHISQWDKHPEFPNSMVVWDKDGAGPLDPVLVAAGGTRIAEWNGSGWTRPGSSAFPGSTNNQVHDLAVYDEDGPGPNPPRLFAAGLFTWIDDVTVTRVARWDGANWTPLGTGVDGGIFTLTTHDPDANGPAPRSLVAGGFFTLAGGATANRVATWDGTAWGTLGPGLTSEVFALRSFDVDGAGPQGPSLFAGGFFAGSTDGDLLVKIARWTGTKWGNIGEGIISDAETVGVLSDGSNEKLVVGGAVWNAGAAQALARVAQWDGQSWSRMGDGLDHTNGSDFRMDMFETYDPDQDGPLAPVLLAGGRFNRSDATVLSNLAQWDGTSWTDFHGGVSSGVIYVNDAIVFDEDAAGPNPPNLFVAGEFKLAGSVTVQDIARWDGSAWSPVGTLNSSQFADMVVWDPDADGPADPALYAAVSADFGAGYVNAVVKWDGSTWSTLGSTLTPGINALDIWDPDGSGPLNPTLVIGGRMSFSANQACIGFWDGSQWLPLGNGRFQYVLDIGVLDEDGDGPQHPTLYICGDFTTVDSVSYDGVARWSGSQWQAIGGFPASHPESCVPFDDDGAGPNPPALFFVGGFEHVGPFASQHIARWGATAPPEVAQQPASQVVQSGDNVSFQVVANEAAPTSALWQRNGVPLFDDARIQGSLDSVLTINNVTPADSGIYGATVANACDSDASQAVSLTVVPPASCDADLDGDGDTDVLDFSIFVQQFGSTGMIPNTGADLDGDGDVDVLDFAVFAMDFGCTP